MPEQPDLSLEWYTSPERFVTPERLAFLDRQKRSRRYQRGYHARVARGIYRLQMREAIMRLTAQRVPDEEIAQRLGQSVPTIRKYRNEVMNEGPKALPPPPPGPPPRRPEPSRRSRARAPSRPIEVLPGPDAVAMRTACLTLRKRAIPFDLIALELGISTAEARSYAAQALREIQASETTHAELERRLMVEQIDDMIRAAYLAATDQEHPSFEAQDRMIKLLDRKAKLLGLDQVPAQDIKIKLQQLAQEGNYDITELEDIAKAVLARHRFKIVEADASDGEVS